MKLTSRQIKQQIFNEQLASLLFANGAYQEERWYANNPDPLNICPICADLDSLGWLPFGTLPKFKQAHSVIGEGNWNCPDSACNCVKGYRRVSGDIPTDIKPLSGNTGENPLSTYFSRVEDAKMKIQKLKDKYKNGCGHDH